MADEIINKLGFDVSEALSALNRLDEALKAARASFNTFGASLDAWNGRAAAALATMRGLASAATRVAGAMQGAGAAPAAAPAAAAPAQTPASQLWLPPGFQSQAQQAARAMAKVGQAGQQAGQKIAGGMTNAGNATSNATQHTHKFVVSFETLARVVTTQLIVRAMSSIRDALKEATRSAIEFQQAIAEIRTIAPTIGRDFTSLSREAAEFSKNFNIPLPQVSEGLYQSISNQFATVSERANVMAASMKLARVGAMDLQDSILLVTGTLNAYGMASSEAEAVAAKFFNTIRLGRIRGKELADTIGAAIPFASQLGISLDELNAAIVAMTIGGMNAHKTMTSLRSVMVQFLKPSEDLKRVVRELGFGSPDQLIAAKGFQGAIEAVANAADNMGSKIAKSIPNIRGMVAELRLSQSGAEQVHKALEAMAESTPESLNKVFEEFRSTDAEKLTASLNKVKVTLTEELGSAIIQVLNAIIQFAGGADNLASIIQALAAAAVPAAAAFIALGVGFAVANISLGPLGLAFAGVTAAVTLFAGASAYASAQAVADIRKMASEQRQATLEFIKDEEEKHRKVREAELAALRESNKNWENRAAVIRRNYFHALDELKDKNKEIIESDRATLQSMVSSQGRVVSAYRRAANEALRAVQQSQQRQLQGEAQYSDAVFKFRAQQADAGQRANEYMRRSRQLAREAADAFSGAKTEEQIQAALAVQQRAEAAAQEAQSIASSTKSVLLQEDAHRNVLGVYRQKINAERQLQALQAKQTQEAAKTAAEEQARANRMKVSMKAILDALQAFNKQGAKTPKQLEEQQKALRENLAKLQKDWLGGKQVSISDFLGLDKLQQRISTVVEGGVSDVEVKRIFAEERTFAQFRQDIEKGVGPFRILIERVKEISPQLAKETEGMSAEESVSYFSHQLRQSEQVITKYRQLGDALKETTNVISKKQEDARNVLSRWVKESGTKEAKVLNDRLMRSNFPEKYKAVSDVILTFVSAAEKFTVPGAKIDEKQFQALNDAYKKYLETIKPDVKSRAALQEFIGEAETAADQAVRAMDLKGGVKALKAEATRARQEIPGIQEALKAAEEAARQTRGATDQAALSAGAAANNLAQVANTDMSRLVSQIGQAAGAMQSLAIASLNVRVPSSADFTAAKGGPVRYLAAGGVVGTDVIPAMLSPGEFVMNAASTRKFASQLVAMNAGVQPVFRSEGGSVTNVGDINVSVNGGGTSRQTARSIAAELRRELRRGTSTL